MNNYELYQKAAFRPATITLDDLNELALNDAVVHSLLTRYQHWFIGGDPLTLEQTLIACVCVLSTQLAATREQLSDCIAKSQRTTITGTVTDSPKQ
jgi:hypothetical protein